MGIIKRQTIKSTVYIYIGAVLGFVTTSLLFPKYLTPEQIGVLGLLVSYAVLSGQAATLGFGGATVRYFPYFRNPEKKHHGFLLLLLIVTIVGFLLFLGIFFLLRPYLMESNQEKSPLFATYLDYIIPLTFFHLLYLTLDTYNRVLYNATTGTLLKEFVQRVFILLFLLMLLAGWIAFGGFLLFYTIAFGLTGLLLIPFLMWRGEFHLRADFSLLNAKMSRGMLSLSAFSFLTGFSGFAVTSIDRIMLNEFFSTYETGIYITAVNFGTLIMLPSRALRGIAPTLIADAFKTRDMDKIADIYQKSTITQWIVGLYFMLGLWGNVDNIFRLLPPEYEAGRYVILLIGLMNLTRMLNGVNDVIVGYSEYYKYNTLHMVVWLGLLVITNFLLIPDYGMDGAAIASLFSLLVVTFVRFFFLYRRFGFQPYGWPHLISTGLALGVYGVVFFLPDAGNFLVDIAIKGTVVTLLFIPAVYFLKLSPDFNRTLDETLKKVF